MKDTKAGLALRAIQKLDELQPTPHRHLIIEAESRLGELLGLECTGVADWWNDDGTPAGYSHNGDTCPIHEWLVPSDAPVSS